MDEPRVLIVGCSASPEVLKAVKALKQADPGLIVIESEKQIDFVIKKQESLSAEALMVFDKKMREEKDKKKKSVHSSRNKFFGSSKRDIYRQNSSYKRR